MTRGRLIRWTSTAVLAGLVLAAPSAQADEEALIKYFRKKFNVPPATKVTVKDLRDSANIKGAKEGTIAIEGPGAKPTGFVASPDLKWVAFADVLDTTQDPAKAIAAKIDLKGEPFKGKADAKVTIVEYSEFQCPFCKKAYDTIENQVMKTYGDRVKFYFKHYPLPFHPWAEPAGIGAECAQEQKPDAYWKLYAAYFEHQGELNPQNLKEKSLEYLKDAGIDIAKWTDCFDNKKTQAKVKAEMTEGAGIGVQGTPAFFINGRFLSGARPFDDFKNIIEDELANAK